MSHKVTVTEPKVLVEGRELKDLSSSNPLAEDLAEVELPFHSKHHTDEETAEYDRGFAEGNAGKPNDDTKTEAWQIGWAEAQE